MKRRESVLAKAVHHGIYVLIVLIPLTGWFYASATASPANYFGFFTVPDLIPANETAGKVLRAVHDIAGKLLLLLLALHVVGALKHHFLDRDDVLKRMLRPLKD
jgi:cytochrome b561